MRIEAPGDGRGKAAGGLKAPRRRHHQRAARAVGGLHAAGLEAGLAEERRVRIADQGADGHAGRQRPDGHGLAEDARARAGSRGRAASGTPKASHRSASQAPAPMSMSCVREALLTSVPCLAPPVRFHSSQLSTVPTQSSPAAARAWPSGAASSSQRSLPAVNMGSTGRPVRAVDLRRPPLRAQSLAELCRAAALPGDRRADGCAAGALPGDAGLALVGDADGRQGRGARSRQALVDALPDGLPDRARRPAGPSPAVGTRWPSAALPGSRWRPAGRRGWPWCWWCPGRWPGSARQSPSRQRSVR